MILYVLRTVATGPQQIARPLVTRLLLSTPNCTTVDNRAAVFLEEIKSVP